MIYIGANDLYRDDLLVQARKGREGWDVVRVALERLGEMHVGRVRVPRPAFNVKHSGLTNPCFDQP